MKISRLFSKTKKEVSKDETSINAQLLIKAGFINKLSAGVYTYLPLGWRVLNKIEDLIREEIDAIGGQEVLMPALHPKENWQKTGRWEAMDCLFKVKANNKEFALGPTHEEIIYPLLKQYVNSYKDLPVSVYQIQTKFRNEARAKSGLLRGREFRMKDLYSFHINDKDRDGYYNLVKKTYLKIFKRIELDTIIAQSSGGTFSDLSLEYQVITPYGEDIIYLCPKCKQAYNKEIINSNKLECPKCHKRMEEKKAIEVGNIFPLKEKFAKDFDLTFIDKNDQKKLVSVGCYGIGSSRIIGTVVETSHDEKGIIWPESISPYFCHILGIGGNDENIKKQTEAVYKKLLQANVEVLYDDRNISIGEKFSDADLIGCSWQIIISPKTLENQCVEIKERKSQKSQLVKIEDLIKNLK